VLLAVEIGGKGTACGGVIEVGKKLGVEIRNGIAGNQRFNETTRVSVRWRNWRR